MTADSNRPNYAKKASKKKNPYLWFAGSVSGFFPSLPLSAGALCFSLILREI